MTLSMGLATRAVGESEAPSAGTGLAVTGLRVECDGGARIVEGIDLSVPAGTVLGLVGESGSGKTTVGLALLAYAKPGARISEGSVCIDGQDVLRLS